MSKLLVKIQNAVFPVRINGARYQNGDEIEIDVAQFTKGTMEIVKKIEDKTPDQDDDGKKDENPKNPDKDGEGNSEFENMSVDELKAYADDHNIDIGRATTEEGIIKKIEEANKAE